MKYIKNEFLTLYNQGFTDKELSLYFKYHIESIRFIRRKLKLSPNKRYPELSLVQKSVLIGTLLGDGALQKGVKTWNPVGKIEHSQTQLEYLLYKKNLIGEITCKLTLKDRYDKRTDKIYKTCWFTLCTHPFLTLIYDKLYQNKKKIISKELLEEYFSDLSLALLYQDDGNKTRDNSYEISLCDFDRNSLETFINFMKLKYDIDCTIRANHKIYIRRNSCSKFIDIIKPYMHSSMLYKLRI